MTKDGCFSKAMGLLLTCTAAVLLSAAPAPAEVVLRGVVLKPHNESTAPAAIDDSDALSWISRDATYEVSSTYRTPETPLSPLPSLLTGRIPPHYQWGGKTDLFAFHTNREANPHIIIALAKVSTIQRLFIKNRWGHRETGPRAAGLTVWVSKDKKSWQRVWTAGRVAPSWMVNLKASVEARYVKIGLVRPDYLHLSLVKIYGPSSAPPDLTRLALADRILLDDGKVLLGTVENKSYAVTAFFGKIEIPASRVVGIVPARDTSARVRLVQTDGQVIAGKLASQAVQLKLTIGSTLSVPLGRIRQFSYRISKDRPDSFPASGRMVLLRSGDRLIWTGCKQKLQLAATWGTIGLPLGGLLRIERPDKNRPGHRVRFCGGSTLSGTLLPDTLALKLALGPVVTLRRQEVTALTTGAKSSVPPDATAMVMRNGDRLVGRLDHKVLTVRTEFGRVKVSPVSVLTMTFDADKARAATVKLWNDSILKGPLAETDLAFALAGGGPTVKVKIAHVASIARPYALSSTEMLNKVEKLIARLAADSYTDREAAMKELLKMGKSIIPLLKKHLASPDAEVRQRIARALKQLGSRE